MKDKVANRVMKNTIALYIRMIFLTLISLFTYRVVFGALGADDYGTYNVVGGFVTMFSFISGTMAISSQRYFAIALETGDWKKVNKTFSINLVIYFLLSVVILAFAETIGLWFVMNKLNLDYSNMLAIVIVYETSIAIFLIGMLVSPFIALLIADENLTIYSWVSILEGILKIVVAYILVVFGGNKLIIYSFLLLFVSIIVNGFYLVYCIRKYRKLRFILISDKDEYKDVFSFINWNLIGAIAAVGKNQGVNIIINLYFGTVVNAARAVAYQLNSIISSFAQNFMKAVDPRITKEYANGNEESFISTIYISSKISYYLLLIISVPFIANVEFVLSVWLKNVPEYAALFTILALLDALFLSITDPLLTAVQAVGKVKQYQLTVGILSLMNLPLSYFLLRINQNPIIPFAVAIGLDCLITVSRMISLKLVYRFSILKYFVRIIVPAAIVTLIASFVSIKYLGNSSSFIELLVKVIICVCFIVFLIILVGLNKREKAMLKDLVFRRKH